MEKLKALEVQINSKEVEIYKLERALDIAREELKSLYLGKKSLKIWDKTITGGTEILFKDDSRHMIKIVVVENDDKFNAVLLTDYTCEYEYMRPYYLFDLNCLFPETIISSLEDDYDLTFVEILDKEKING